MASIPLVFLVSILSFAMQALAPGDPARTILGDDYTPEQYAALRHQLGLDDPIPVQYWHWLRSVFDGSMGESLYNHQPVTSALNQRVEVTVWLIAITVLVTGVCAVALGIASAVLRNGFLARVIDTLSVLGNAIPTFWLGLTLIALLAVQMRAFPVAGYVSPAESIGDWAWSLTLPVLTLAVGALSLIAKLTRDAMLEVLDQEFVTALRSRGLSETRIVLMHALRAAAIPVVTALGLLLVGLLSGTVMVETVFGMPGLGGLAVRATTQHDLPLVQGVVLYFTLIVVVVNLLVDIGYAWLNPRARAA